MIDSTHTALMASAGDSTAVTKAFWDLIAGAVQLAAIIRTIRVPASRWTYRRWSKWAAVGLAGWMTFTVGAIALPVGAIAVIWHTRTIARRTDPPPTVPDLPFAEGSSATGDER